MDSDIRTGAGFLYRLLTRLPWTPFPPADRFRMDDRLPALERPVCCRSHKIRNQGEIVDTLVGAGVAFARFGVGCLFLSNHRYRLRSGFLAWLECGSCPSLYGHPRPYLPDAPYLRGPLPFFHLLGSLVAEMSTQRWGQRELAQPKRQCHVRFGIRGHWLCVPEANPSPHQGSRHSRLVRVGPGGQFCDWLVMDRLAQGSAMDPLALLSCLQFRTLSLLRFFSSGAPPKPGPDVPPRDGLPGAFMKIIDSDLSKKLNPPDLQRSLGFPSDPISHQNRRATGNNSP